MSTVQKITNLNECLHDKWYCLVVDELQYNGEYAPRFGGIYKWDAVGRCFFDEDGEDMDEDWDYLVQQS